MFKRIKGMGSAWFGLFQRTERMATLGTAKGAAQWGAVARYPTHSRVVLPDGQLMYVRQASLAAAKDLLAAQRSIERRMRAEGAAHRLRDVSTRAAVECQRSELAAEVSRSVPARPAGRCLVSVV
ncbi:MAG TPA: hypothetical protein VIC27_02280 [Ktedonobacterales bacterium]